MCHAKRTGITKVSYPNRKPFWLMTADEQPCGRKIESREEAEEISKQFAKIWSGRYVGEIKVTEKQVFDLLRVYDE